MVSFCANIKESEESDSIYTSSSDLFQFNLTQFANKFYISRARTRRPFHAAFLDRRFISLALYLETLTNFHCGPACLGRCLASLVKATSFEEKRRVPPAKRPRRSISDRHSANSTRYDGEILYGRPSGRRSLPSSTCNGSSSPSSLRRGSSPPRPLISARATHCEPEITRASLGETIILYVVAFSLFTLIT